jgi:hypothetical protein
MAASASRSMRRRGSTGSGSAKSAGEVARAAPNSLSAARAAASFGTASREAVSPDEGGLAIASLDAVSPDEGTFATASLDAVSPEDGVALRRGVNPADGDPDD